MEERLAKLEQQVERIMNAFKFLILQNETEAAAFSDSFREVQNIWDTHSRISKCVLERLLGRETQDGSNTSSSSEEEKVILCDTTSDSESSSYDPLDDIPVPPLLEVEKEEANANEEENEEEESSNEEEEDIVPMDIAPLFEDADLISNKRRVTPFHALRTELESKKPGAYFKVWRRWDRILRVCLQEIIPRLGFGEEAHFRTAVVRYLLSPADSIEQFAKNVDMAFTDYDAMYNHIWENYPRARQHISTVRSTFMEFQDILAELK